MSKDEWTQDQKHSAYSLAQMILEPERHGPKHSMDGVAIPTVTLHMDTMVRSITKDLRFDFALIAGRVEAELRKQCDAVNMDDEIKRLVEQYIGAVRAQLREKIHRRVEGLVSQAIDDVAGPWAKRVAKKMTEKLLKLMVQP